MTRLGYKMTEIGEIPEEWKVSKISDVFDVLTGTTPSTKISKYWEGGNIDWLTPKDLRSLGAGLSIPQSDRKITKEGVAESSLELLPAGSIVISTRAPVGYVGIATNECTFNQGCKGLLAKENAIPLFHAYYLSHETEYLNSLSSGSTFKELSKDALEKVPIVVPPNAEQQKIAEILTTADRKIELIDKEIQTAEKLKKGLMQTLLTRGIGHTKFKKTEIGEIPEEWELLPMNKLAQYINGMAFKPSEWKEDGIPIVRIENLNDLNAPFNYYGGQVDEKYILKNEDILLSWSASLGVYLWNRGKAVLNQHIFKVIPRKDISKYYLFWSLHRAIENLSRFTHGSTMKHFQKGELERTKLALPHFPEQQKIAEILTTADRKIELLNRKKKQAERLKKGLMQILLTGQMRVKIDPSKGEN